jgi:uncharacterized delta-60 repeat protein
MIPSYSNAYIAAFFRSSSRACLVIVSIFATVTPILAAPGQLDPTFALSGKSVTSIVPFSNALSGLAVQTDGKIVAAGSCLADGGDFCIARFNANGTLDTTFDGDGKVVTPIVPGANDWAPQIALQSDGKIVLAGSCRYGANAAFAFCVARYLNNGAMDGSFNGVGKVVVPFDPTIQSTITTVIVQPNGRILVGGYCSSGSASQFCMQRYLQNGMLDGSFGDQGMVFPSISVGTDNRIVGLALQSDGKIVAAGSCGPVSGNHKFCAVRYSELGVIDASFGTAGVADFAIGAGNNQPKAIGLQSSGSIVLSGECQTDSGYQFCALRLQTDGVLDTTFGTSSGYTITAVQPGSDHFATAMIVQPDDRILLAGSCGLGVGSSVCVHRTEANGVPDSTFGTGGRTSTTYPVEGAMNQVTAASLQRDGRVLVGGYCGGGMIYSFCIVRFIGLAQDPLNCALNVDADNAVLATTDALLITRYLLGYRSNALTTGAVGASPTRTNAEIETYLGTLLQAGKLDVDGDGQSLAMTDGLLLIRAMLGLSGTALTNSATNATHPNARNAQQILTWIESTHGVACLP